MKFKALVLLLVSNCFFGCASIQSLSEHRTGGPLVMSGTRLNIASLSNQPDKQIEERFNCQAVAHPVLDIPFSLLSDVFLLAATVPSALAERVLH